MVRSTDPRKVALWRGRFRRFVDSGVPVARFCAAEQVSECSFYYWRKKLGPLGRGRVLRAEDHTADCESRRAVTEDRKVFRPVTVVPAACGVVVRLPNGASIEVEASQLDTIRAVVAEIVQADHHDRTAQPHQSSTRPYRSSAGRVIRNRGDLR